MILRSARDVERPPESVAVVLATYRQPQWLRKSLWGYANQTFTDFELLVADDGSGAETEAVIEEFRRDTPLRIRHVWQEDRGFRKSEILNRAILETRADYLIFSDGDCIPRADFVRTHVELAEPGRFLGGGALRLPARTSHRIRREDILSGRCMRLRWLVRNGWWPGHRFMRLTRSRRLATWLDRITPSKSVFNGGNASVWREAAEAVNGFDQDMSYKGQDRAFGDRLEHLGLRCQQVRHRAVVLHLHHHRPWATREAIERSDSVRARIRHTGEVRARQGLAELPGDRTVS